MTLTRRRLAALGAPLIAPQVARAQPAWPARTITMVVPYAAGGNVDGVARVVAPALAARLGQQVVVENATGAGGVIGTDRFLRAPADGYTLLLGVESNVVVAPLVSPATAKYALADFAPIALLATQPLVLVARPDLPATTLDEFVAFARAQPAGLTYATSGTGTSLHVLGEMLRQRTGLVLEHVPYRLGPQILPDLSTGRIDLAVLPVPSVAPMLAEGRIKAFAVSSPGRAPTLPNVAAFRENATFADIEMIVWQGLFARSGTDAAIVARLARECALVVQEPAVLARFAALGVAPAALTGERFGAFLAAESERFGAVIRAGNIRAE